jgi:putative LysE/RhtB family amino acid efflux pump
VLIYFFIGLAIGILTGVPIGPANVAVIDAAYRHTLRRAIAVGLGAAMADGLYALLGIVGTGPLLVSHPKIPPVLYAVSGFVLVVYGVLTVRAQPVTTVEGAKKATTPSKEMWSGFTLGIALIFLNPAALVTWVVIVGSYLGDISTPAGIGATLGIAIGSFSWFTFVAYLANHGRKLGKAMWMTRVVGVLLVGYGLFSLGKAIRYFFFL